MEYLNLQRLRRCCRPDASGMDETEVTIIHETLLLYLIPDLKIYKMTQSLYTGGYIGDEIFRNVERHFERVSEQNELRVSRRVVSYLTNKVSFVAFLWALSTSGHQSYANILLSALEHARFSTLSPQITKVPVRKNRHMYLLVKQLKYISDSKLFDNPVAFIRRLSMRYKERLKAETEVNNTRKLADRYFGVLAVELDNVTFLKNRFVSAKSLVTEMRRVTPWTSNPTMNEVLLNGRVAEMTALSGDVEKAKSAIQDVTAVMLNTEVCPESGNLMYMQLNVLLSDYEKNPSNDKKEYYVQMGYNGLRLLRVLDEDLMAVFRISYMLKIIFCILDLSISGRPIYFEPCKGSLDTARFFLTEVGKVVNRHGQRKTMCYSLAMGRMFHLTGDVGRAIEYWKKAKELAQQGSFVEFQHIDQYEERLSSVADMKNKP